MNRLAPPLTARSPPSPCSPPAAPPPPPPPGGSCSPALASDQPAARPRRNRGPGSERSEGQRSPPGLGQILVATVEVGGEPVGCLGSGDSPSPPPFCRTAAFCEGDRLPRHPDRPRAFRKCSKPPPPTAKAKASPPVSGPVNFGEGPYQVTTPGRWVPPLELPASPSAPRRQRLRDGQRLREADQRGLRAPGDHRDQPRRRPAGRRIGPAHPHRDPARRRAGLRRRSLRRGRSSAATAPPGRSAACCPPPRRSAAPMRAPCPPSKRSKSKSPSP